MGLDGLAARRRALGLSQEQLAYMLDRDPTTIGRWERGETTPQPVHRAALARALGVTLAELNELLAAPRRTAPPPTPGEADLRATTRQIVALDTRYGGDDLLTLAVRSFRNAQACFARGDETDAPGVAEAGQVAAWVAYDADRQDLSRRLHYDALAIARLAGDRPLVLFLLASLAMQATFVGNGREALRIADDVLHDGALSPRTEALFLVRKARALALAGDHRRALAALGRASAVVAGTGAAADPDWTWWITDAELSWHDGMIHAAVHDWPTAIGRFEAAVADRGTHLSRSRYNDTAHLLLGQLAAGAWRDAEPVAAELASRFPEVNSGRTRTILRRALDHAAEAPRLPTALDDATAYLRRALTSEPGSTESP